MPRLYIIIELKSILDATCVVVLHYLRYDNNIIILLTKCGLAWKHPDKDARGLSIYCVNFLLFINFFSVKLNTK